MRTRRIGMVAGLALLAAACAAPEAVPEASGPSEGIAVHGDWTIEVIDGNGELAQRREFPNAFVAPGALVIILSGWGVASGEWAIAFRQVPEVGQDDGPCPSEIGGWCTSDADVDFEGGAGDNRIVLTSSSTAEADGVIEEVKTSVPLCSAVDGSISPADCASRVTNPAPFTLKVLDEADVLPVAAGQTVQIEVVLSFTSG